MITEQAYLSALHSDGQSDTHMRMPIWNRTWGEEAPSIFHAGMCHS